MPLQIDEPNRFDLQGIGVNVHITYSTTSNTGQPIFSYTDSEGTRNFTGNQISTQETNMGMLVTVALRMTVDTGGTALTLLVPAINLGGSAQEFKTIAVVTTTRISIPFPVKGASQSYEVINLQGTADNVIPTLGAITGKVYDKNSKVPIENATVTVGSNSGNTDPGGKYSLSDVPPGPQHITASADGYVDSTQNITVIANKTITVDFSLKEVIDNPPCPNKKLPI